MRPVMAPEYAPVQPERPLTPKPQVASWVGVAGRVREVETWAEVHLMEQWPHFLQEKQESFKLYLGCYWFWPLKFASNIGIKRSVITFLCREVGGITQLQAFRSFIFFLPYFPFLCTLLLSLVFFFFLVLKHFHRVASVKSTEQEVLKILSCKAEKNWQNGQNQFLKLKK